MSVKGVPVSVVSVYPSRAVEMMQIVPTDRFVTQARTFVVRALIVLMMVIVPMMSGATMACVNHRFAAATTIAMAAVNAWQDAVFRRYSVTMMAIAPYRGRNALITYVRCPTDVRRTMIVPAS